MQAAATERRARERVELEAMPRRLVFEILQKTGRRYHCRQGGARLLKRFNSLAAKREGGLVKCVRSMNETKTRGRTSSVFEFAGMQDKAYDLRFPPMPFMSSRLDWPLKDFTKEQLAQQAKVLCWAKASPEQQAEAVKADAKAAKAAAGAKAVKATAKVSAVAAAVAVAMAGWTSYMQISIKTLTDTTITLKVDSEGSDTIENVKVRLDRLAFSPERPYAEPERSPERTHLSVHHAHVTEQPNTQKGYY